jgi:glycosyltransferase involved in cell wall biosynthesis
MKITGRIIARNEERKIGATIDALKVVCDEVLVIDSGSADGTVAIAESMGARVVYHPFEGYGAQKNFGDSQATFDYILSVDADEVLSPELQRSILAIKQSGTASAYAFNILTHIGTTPIYGCGLYPDAHVRLYLRSAARWSERTVHEELVVSGKEEYLQGDLLHYSYADMEDLHRKTDYYARLGAELYKGKSKLWLIYKMLVNSIAKFIKVYILQKGILAGRLGLDISIDRMRGTFLKYYWALE